MWRPQIQALVAAGFRLILPDLRGFGETDAPAGPYSMEIFADDVICGHGATSGDLNHDHLFYLMSRGISASDAKSLLIAAFVGEA
jgi:Fe-S cluster assembly scaffold protein SufB